MADNKPFLADYAKSNKSTCKTTSKKIPAGKLRIATMIKSRHFDGMQPVWNDGKAFLTASTNSKRKRPQSVDEIDGYDDLRPEDQKNIEEWISKYSTETKKNSSDDDMKKQQKKASVLEQATQIWKIRDITSKETKLPASSIKAILEENDIPTKGISPADLVRTLAETMYFGVPTVGNKNAGCCATRPLHFSSVMGRYVCEAPLAWGACTYTQSVEETNCHAAVLPTPLPKGVDGEWVDEVTKVCGVGFPPHDRLYIEKTTTTAPSSSSTASSSLSSTKPVPSKPKKAKAKEIRKSHLSRACVDPDSKLVASHHVLDEAYDTKGTTKPDPTEAYPIELYDTVLCMTDLSTGTNSQYKLQVLIPDSSATSSSGRNGKVSACLWRVWGRVGGIGGGGSKLDKYSSIDSAKNEFCKLYKKYSGNEWTDRKNFVKYPGKFFQLDVSYIPDDNNDDDDDDGDGTNNKTVKVIVGDPNSKIPLRVQEVIASIFDKGIAIKQLKSLKVDLTQMPLGKMTEAQLKDAYSVLTEIEQVLSSASSTNTITSDPMRSGQLEQLSNQFYSKCPSTDPIKIDSSSVLKEKIELVDELINLQASSSVMTADNSTTGTNTQQAVTKSPMDTAYEKLMTDLTPLDPTGDEYIMLNKYVENTRNATVSGVHGWGSNDWGKRGLRLIDAFAVDRHGEAAIHEPSKTLGNRRLLWHGSRIANYSGILRQGLRIAPPEAPKSGYRFGKGVYFADMLGKSANYCRTDGSSEMLVMACDVSLGSTFETDRDMYMEKAKPGTSSTHALSEIIPDPAVKEILYDDPNAPGGTNDEVMVPLGTPIRATNVNNRRPSCDVSEFIIYDQAQVRIRYLLRLTTNPSTKAASDLGGNVAALPNNGGQPQTANPSPPVVVPAATASAKRGTVAGQSQPASKRSRQTVSAFIKLEKEDQSLPSSSGLKVLSCRTFVEGLRLTVVKGDIADSKTQAIVVPSDAKLSLAGMVGERVKAVAGAGLVSEVNALLGGAAQPPAPVPAPAAPAPTPTPAAAAVGGTGLPRNFTRLTATADGDTIRQIAIAANVPYLTPYYLVIRKEKVSNVKDVICIESNGTFHRGTDARNFIGMGNAKHETIVPTQIPAGAQVFIQSSSHNRKTPFGSQVLLETGSSAAVAAPAPAPVAAPSARAVAVAAASTTLRNLRTSDVCVMGGHNLPASNVVFVVSPVYSQYSFFADAQSALIRTVKNALMECSRHKFSTIALPSIGSGRAGYDKGLAAKWIIRAIADYLDDNNNNSAQHIQEVCFCLYDDESLDAYEKGIASHDSQS